VVLVSLFRRYQLGKSVADKKLAVVYERSLAVAREVFIQHSSHLLDPADLYILKNMSIVGEQTFETDVKKVYLTAADEVIMDRIRRRDRPAERAVPDRYLLQLKHRMDRWAADSDLRVIDTTRMSVEDVASKILEVFEGNYSLWSKCA